MPKITLTEYAIGKTQIEVAKQVNVSREAISQMLSSDREIYVEIDQVGAVKAWEKRYLPARKVSAAQY